MLQKQSVPINFQNGMDTKTDSKQLDLGTMYQIINGVYTSPKKIKKRNGYNALSNYDSDNVSLPTLESLAVFNNELVAFTNDALYSYSDSIEKWVEKGVVSNLNITSVPVFRNAYNATKVGCATVENIAVFVWKDSRGGSYCSAMDLQTNTLFLSEEQLTSSGDNPKVVVNQNQFYLFYNETGNLKYKKINSATPTTLGTAVTVKTDLDSSNPYYDIINVNDRIYVTYNTSTAGDLLKIFYILSTDVLGTTVGFGGTINADGALTISSDSLDRIWIAYYDNTSVFARCMSYPLTTTILTSTTIETLANVTNISLIEAVNGAYMEMLYTVYNATSSNTLIRKAEITVGGTVSGPVQYLRSVGQASKLFRYGDELYTILVHDSTLQSTYFVATIGATIQAKFSAGTGGTVIAQNSLSDVGLIADGSFLAATQVKSLITQTATAVVSTFGVNRSVINFEPTLNYQDTTLGQNLYISGGTLKNYDGATVTEDNFYLYPEGLTAGANSASGGSMSNGTYQYIAIYSWFDNKGQLHRSATSLPLTVTLAAGGTSQTQIVNIPTLRLTQKRLSFIELYRTEASGTLFYAVTTLTSPEFNTEVSNTKSITDSISDATLIGREPLYTTGGILDNDPSPNASIVTTWKNRLIVAGLEDEQQLGYSKEYTPGTPPQFSDFFRINVSNQGGPITALGVLDDKLIIFKQSSLYVLSGNGPNAAGEQNDYGTPDLISSDAGCSDPSSIVVTPFGLMFKSSKGIQLLDRGLTIQYVGAPVEAYNAYTITAASLVSNSNQVRFLTSNNYALVYDTYFQKWSVFDNHGGKDGEIVDGVYTYLRNDGLVFEEDNSNLDNGEAISLYIDTGWLSFAGIQGYQRVYKMLGLGEFYSPHQLLIQAYYNYNDIVLSEKTINSEDFINSEAYGDSTTYGSDAFYGGDANLNAYQFRLDMKIQKAQSIRIKITELQNDTYGQGLALSNLNFEVGLKAGTGKINQSQTFGMTR